MATDPIFAATPQLASALLGAAETNLQAPTAASSVFAAASTGSKIEEIVVAATATSLVPSTVAGLVYIFLYDAGGPTYHLYDTIPITAITASATTAGFRVSKTYTNLILKSGWGLRASQSIAGNASILKLTLFGGDF